MITLPWLLSHLFGPFCYVVGSVFPATAGSLVALVVALADGPLSHAWSRWTGATEVTVKLGVRQLTTKTTMKFWREDPAILYLAKEACKVLLPCRRALVRGVGIHNLQTPRSRSSNQPTL